MSHNIYYMPYTVPGLSERPRRPRNTSYDSGSSSMPTAKSDSKKKLLKSVKTLASKLAARIKKDKDDYEEEPSFFDDPCIAGDSEGLVDIEQFNNYRGTRGLPAAVLRIPSRGTGDYWF